MLELVRTDVQAVVHALGARGVPGPSRIDTLLRDKATLLLGPGPANWATEVARDTCDAIVAFSFSDVDPPTRVLGEAVEGSLLLLLMQLAGHPAPSAYVTELQREIMRHRIAHGTPFERVVGSQRMAQNRWTDLLLDAAVERDAGPEVMRTIVGALDKFFDEAIDWHLRSYLAEQERFLHSEAADRARLITALVAGRQVDPAAVRRRLGTDLSRPLVGLVLTDSSGIEADGDEGLRRVSAELQERTGATAVLSHRPSAHVAWLWLEHLDTQLTDLLGVEALLRESGLRAGVGSPRRGAEGFRRTHAEACDADRFSRHLTRPLVRYPEIALAALLSADLERARWFVCDQLKGLARADAKNAELRDTLSAYYSGGMRLSAASTALHLHRNTLVYRLRHIAELLGHPVGQAIPEKQCALLLAATFGDAVLTIPTESHLS